MLPSCALCNRSDPRRMIALMAIWFGRLAGLPSDGGYFYLCPACYTRLVEPHLQDVVCRLVEQHPFLHRLAAAQDAHRSQPARQAGAHPIPMDVPARSPAGDEAPGSAPSPPGPVEPGTAGHENGAEAPPGGGSAA